jgi:hypothetical protein
MNEIIQKPSTTNTKHSKIVEVHILPKHPRITKPTHTQTPTLQNKLKYPSNENQSHALFILSLFRQSTSKG